MANLSVKSFNFDTAGVAQTCTAARDPNNEGGVYSREGVATPQRGNIPLPLATPRVMF